MEHSVNVPSVAFTERKRHKKRHRAGFLRAKIFVFELKTAILCVRSDSGIEYEAAAAPNTQTYRHRHTDTHSTASGMETPGMEPRESEWKPRKVFPPRGFTHRKL